MMMSLEKGGQNILAGVKETMKNNQASTMRNSCQILETIMNYEHVVSKKTDFLFEVLR
jgi:hypothetical protein